MKQAEVAHVGRELDGRLAAAVEPPQLHGVSLQKGSQQASGHRQRVHRGRRLELPSPGQRTGPAVPAPDDRGAAPRGGREARLAVVPRPGSYRLHWAAEVLGDEVDELPAFVAEKREAAGPVSHGEDRLLDSLEQRHHGGLGVECPPDEASRGLRLPDPHPLRRRARDDETGCEAGVDARRPRGRRPMWVSRGPGDRRGGYRSVRSACAEDASAGGGLRRGEGDDGNALVRTGAEDDLGAHAGEVVPGGLLDEEEGLELWVRDAADLDAARVGREGQVALAHRGQGGHTRAVLSLPDADRVPIRDLGHRVLSRSRTSTTPSG
ncbi:MAG: hypothetical protein ACRDNE_01815 [Gaiellaceae bacterium]